MSVFEAVGARATGALTDEELALIERSACPTMGSCAGMFTANTMASVSEALGMALPGSASPAAVDDRRDDLARQSGQAVIRLLELGIRPRQIMTKAAFENAIAVTMALGGSTNAVLHLLAIANEARVELTLDDFDRIGRQVPHIADTKPHGRYHMVDIDRVGGVPVVMRALLEAGLVHGDCLTVTGRTVAENLDALAPARPDGQVIRPVAEPIHADGGIAILRGSLAPEGAVVKVAGIDQDHFEGVARVFDGEDQAMEAILAGSITPGTVAGHPLRGSEGRSRDAGDAGRHRGHEGRRAGRGLRPHDRRPFQRRDPRVLCRPCGPRSGGRRAHRPRRRRRPGRRSTCRPAASTSWSSRPSSTGGGRSGSARNPAIRPACWPSSPGWSPGPNEAR